MVRNIKKIKSLNTLRCMRIKSQGKWEKRKNGNIGRREPFRGYCIMGTKRIWSGRKGKMNMKEGNMGRKGSVGRKGMLNMGKIEVCEGMECRDMVRRTGIKVIWESGRKGNMGERGKR